MKHRWPLLPGNLRSRPCEYRQEPVPVAAGLSNLIPPFPTTMAKDKKKSSKKGKDSKSDNVLDGAFQALRKFRKATRSVGKLTTGQKVVGGVALLAAGLTYLAKKHAEDEAANKALPGAEAAEAALASLSEPAAPEAPDAPSPSADEVANEPQGQMRVVSKSKKRR
ncbi:hypothetical protein [Hymenobacter cellulosilyticus]|uniref:Uncharacterized protein n=1 Tax=Hymenobacter cellulosilyticus TaxID=2932248 RepID=A0A8T9Q7D5_9BACT|nr:hypothetical protein [Hymenobacter cellulosilyticus]UOQ72852.1 hypothetical protein MUN79_02345 [Hymenobacter cellulosilyticus]